MMEVHVKQNILRGMLIFWHNFDWGGSLTVAFGGQNYLELFDVMDDP